MLKQDFFINELGDIVLENDEVKMVHERDIYVQAFRLILSTRLGEYFLNLDEGLDFDAFFGKKELDEALIMEALQLAAQQVDDFVKFTTIGYSLDRIKRKLQISFKALFNDGFQIDLEEEVNFGA